MKSISRRSLLTHAVPVVAAGMLLASPAAAAEKQPQMQDALDALRTAKTHLEKAHADKGGHRKKALELVQDAIIQVEAGIAYDSRH